MSKIPHTNADNSFSTPASHTKRVTMNFFYNIQHILEQAEVLEEFGNSIFQSPAFFSAISTTHKALIALSSKLTIDLGIEEFILGSPVMPLILDVLRSVLLFEEFLDSTTVGLSQEIIQATGAFITGVIATHMPLLGLLSGIIVKDLTNALQKDNLSKSLDAIKARMDAIKEKKNLQKCYENAETILEIAHESGVPLRNLPILHNIFDDIKNVKTLIKNSIEEKQIFQTMCNIVSTNYLPDMLCEIKKEFVNIIPSEELISKYFDTIIGKIEKPLKSQKLHEKLHIVAKTVNNLTSLAEKLVKKSNLDSTKAAGLVSTVSEITSEVTGFFKKLTTSALTAELNLTHMAQEWGRGAVDMMLQK